MDVYLIKASAPGPFKEYKKAMGAPPQSIFSAAAATPVGVGVGMCDETIGMKPKLNARAEIVALFFHTPDAPHAYDLADKYRARSKTVVLGGLHPTALPDEALIHADAVLVGEAEGIWEELIGDYENNALKDLYRRQEPVELSEVSFYPTDRISASRYGYVWSVLVSRGCVHRCAYCAVPPFFNGKYRCRPVENIVAEITSAPSDWIELHADNLTADRSYALELFRALEPLGINWFGEATAEMADDDELLQVAAQSGCRELLIGVETSSQRALKEVGKRFVDPRTTKARIDRFHDHGIRVISPIMFGFDAHTPGIFEETERFCREIGIDEVEPVVVIPFPGTPLFERLDGQGRVLTRDWSQYDGSHAVFQPANMSPEELEAGVNWFWNEIRKNSSSTALRGETASNSGPATRKGRAKSGGPVLSTGGSPRRWKSILALFVIGVGFALDWYWIWGALLVVWGVTDLRNRQTYLLDPIPRAESPKLYWIVVLMWLMMGLWGLSTTSLMVGLMDIARAESDAYTGPVQQDWRRVQNDRFGFGFEVPSGWACTEWNDSDSVTLHLQNRGNTATITAIAVDCRNNFSLERFSKVLSTSAHAVPAKFGRSASSNRKELWGNTIESFIGYMERELHADLPFLAKARSTVPGGSFPIDDAVTKMVYRQYHGELEGENVSAWIGYAVCQNYGYSMIGVFGEGDSWMRDVADRVLTSSRLTES